MQKKVIIYLETEQEDGLSFNRHVWSNIEKIGDVCVLSVDTEDVEEVSAEKEVLTKEVFADKQVRDLTEDDLLDILTDMNDTGELTWAKWKRVLQARFILHNYLTDVGMVRWLLMMKEEAECGMKTDMKALEKAIRVYGEEVSECRKG